MRLSTGQGFSYATSSKVVFLYHNDYWGYYPMSVFAVKPGFESSLSPPRPSLSKQHCNLELCV